jgi:2,5-diamino-6-(ribosylamino)-4(3H)-pyrimidinone 5'-phosphate reductase
LHNLTSLDGRLDGFTPDVELYYETAARLPHQAVLTGSGTLLAAAAVEGIDLSGVDRARGTGSPPADASRPWLVIVDSAGRVSRLDWLRRRPVWRDVLVLCSETTPAGHLERLQRTGVEHLVLGAARVDLAAALTVLADRYGVADVRVDAGGSLNGALLAAGLVDRVSTVVAPVVAGSGDGSARPVAAATDREATLMRLTSVEHLRNGHVWLRHERR